MHSDAPNWVNPDTTITLNIEHATADVIERMDSMFDEHRVKVEGIIRQHLLLAMQEIRREFPAGIPKRKIQR
jgi:hypothetical protein